MTIAAALLHITFKSSLQAKLTAETMFLSGSNAAALLHITFKSSLQAKLMVEMMLFRAGVMQLFSYILPSNLACRLS